MLDVPPIAKDSPEAIEMLRVWTLPDGPQQVTLRTNWNDAAGWGLLLVDIARHVAKAYENQGNDFNSTLSRIYDAFNAEWNLKSDEPKDLGNV